MPVSVRSSDGTPGGFRMGLASVLQGVGLALVAALASSIAIGLAVAWTPQWDAADSLLSALNVAAIAAGGWFAGRRAPRLIWLHGGLVGLVYMLLAAWMLSPEPGWVAQLTAAGGWLPLVYGFLAGAAGGVIGALFNR